MLTIFYSLNRAFLGWGRGKVHWFLYTVIFPILATNSATFPGAAAIITNIKALWETFYTAAGARQTIIADSIYSNILNQVVVLMKYCVTTAANNLDALSLCGFTINKTSKSPNPQTAIPTNIKQMVTGGGTFLLRATTDQYCHQLIARTKLKTAPDTDWVQNETSQTDSIYFEGYVHATDLEVQLCAEGTAGRSEWSVSIFVLVD